MRVSTWHTKTKTILGETRGFNICPYSSGVRHFLKISEMHLVQNLDCRDKSY